MSTFHSLVALLHVLGATVTCVLRSEELLCLLCHFLQLDLRGNGLGNDGAIIIGRGLRTAETKVLAELDLGYNEIKDDGACALAQVR